MNAIHRFLTAIFDVILTPFEALGDVTALVLVSGLFGIAALLLFKQISWQAGIKRTKDRIKGHMIAIRIYQDDLAIVFGSVAKVVLRNFQYLGLNFGPILPLFVPFVLIASQFVVRYGFDPLPVVDESVAEARLPGRGHMLTITMKREHRDQVGRLSVQLPPNLKALSPLVRNAHHGVAVMEFAAVAPGSGDIQLLIDGSPVGSKAVAAGEATRQLQPERVSSFWSSWLWPAEPTFPAACPVEKVTFVYPERDLGFLPGGPLGVLITFFLASILFGIAILKPLHIQI